MRTIEKTESAFEAIEKSILNGSTPPGAALRVAALSRELNVSATPIREALARLEERRLVVPGPNCGWRVAPVSLGELEDLEGARLTIEETLLKDSIEQGDIEWESNLVAAHHRLTRTQLPVGRSTTEIRERWAKAHDDFHKGLLCAGRSSWLLSFHHTTQLQLQRHHEGLLYHAYGSNRDASKSPVPQSQDALRRALAPEHHGLLMEAAIDRDQNAAKRLLHEHVQMAIESYRAILS